MDILFKYRTYNKLNGHLDSNTRTWDKLNSCPIANWYILVSGQLLTTCSSQVHQQQEWRIFSTRQKWGSISRCELSQRKRGRRRSFRTTNPTRDVYYEWNSALQISKPITTLYSFSLLWHQRDSRACQQKAPCMLSSPAHSYFSTLLLYSIFVF